MWKAFYIATSHEPATEFGGWRPTDFKAAALRDHIERCRLSRLLHNASAESRLLHNASAEAPANRSSSTSRSMPSSSASSHADGSPSAGVTSGVGMAGDATGRRSHGRSLRTASRHSGGHSGHSGGARRRSSPSRIAHDPCAKVPKKLLNRLDELHRAPPYPFANGPLIVLSRPLASLLAVDAYPVEWLASLERTPVLQFYRQRGRVPFVLRKDACFPASFDAVLGWWVYQVALRHRLRLALVDSPFMIQHHPWVAYRHGAFSNASLILHELKNPRSPGWAFALAQGSGPFVPTPRECGPCGTASGAGRLARDDAWRARAVSGGITAADAPRSSGALPLVVGGGLEPLPLERDAGEDGGDGGGIPMGWSTVRRSPVARWECCGQRSSAEAVRKACDERVTELARCAGPGED